MILARPAILEARAAGRLLIEPFDERNVGPNSYDVTLGPWYWCERRLLEPHQYPVAEKQAYQSAGFDVELVMNPYDQASSRRSWESEPRKAQARNRALPGIPAGTPVIVLGPGQNVLAHTIEFIGGCDDRLTTSMRARSSIGRNHVTVARCAGSGDVGYRQRWTLELTNSGTRAIILVPGRRIAQVVFHDTTGLGGTDQYGARGKYHQKAVHPGMTAEQLEATWTPADMLPRMWEDREVLVDKGQS